MGAEIKEHASVKARASAGAERTDEAQRRKPAVGAALYAASALSLFAALIHLWAMPEHMEEWWAYGAFFLAAAAAQGLFGVLVLRWPGPLLHLAGIGGNVAIVCLYVVSRTVGIPRITDEDGIPIFGPHSGDIEEVGLLDMSATTAEVGLIVILVALLDDAWRRKTVNALLLVGASIWALRLAGVLS